MHPTLARWWHRYPAWRGALAMFAVLTAPKWLRHVSPQLDQELLIAVPVREDPGVLDDSAIVVRFGPHEHAALPVRIAATFEGSSRARGEATLSRDVAAVLDRRQVALRQTIPDDGPFASLPGPHTSLTLNERNQDLEIQVHRICPPLHSLATQRGINGHEQLVHRTMLPGMRELRQQLIDEALSVAARSFCLDIDTLTTPDVTDQITTQHRELQVTLGDPINLHQTLQPRFVGHGPPSDSLLRAPTYAVQDTSIARLTAFGLEGVRPGSTTLEIRQFRLLNGVATGGQASASVRITVRAPTTR